MESGINNLYLSDIVPATKEPMRCPANVTVDINVRSICLSQTKPHWKSDSSVKKIYVAIFCTIQTIIAFPVILFALNLLWIY